MPIDQNAVVPDEINPSAVTVDPPAAPRGALGEIGTGIARSALVDLPTMAGKTLQYAGADNVGASVRKFGEDMGAKPSMQLRPEDHGWLVNNLAQGAEIAGAALPAMAIGAGAATLGAPALAATAIGAASLGALGGGSAGQDTLEKAKAKGLDDETARHAAALNAGATFAGQTAMGMVGGRLLGGAGTAIGKVIGIEGKSTAEGILGQMAGQDGILKPLAKSLPGLAAENVGLGMGQAGVSAGIENAYGVDDRSPWESMKEQIGPMLGLTAVMSPLGLAGRALSVRNAQDRAKSLAGTDATPEIRSQLADQYAVALAKADPQKAAAFRQNAQNAILENKPLPIDASLFTPDTIQGPQYTDGQREMFGAPPAAGSGAPLAPGEQGDMFGGGGMREANENPNQGDLFEQPAAPERTGDQAELDLSAPPAPTEPVQVPQTPPAMSTQAFINQLTGADSRKPTKKQTEAAKAEAEAAFNAPSGVWGQDAATGHERELTVQDRANQLYPEQAEAPAAAQEPATAAQEPATAAQEPATAAQEPATAAPAPREANATKATDEITTDITAANKTVTGQDTIKKQALVPVQKQLDKLGIDKMATHQEQIDALDNLLADKDAKIGQTTRDRLAALSAQWKEAMPKAEEPAAQVDPRAAEYETLLNKLRSDGLSREESDRMQALDPSRPSDEAVAQMAKDAGVSEDWLAEHPGFFKSDGGYKTGQYGYTPEQIKGFERVDQGEAAVRRAYGDDVRARTALEGIRDQAIEAGYSPQAHADLLEAEAARQTGEANTEGSFENKLRTARWQEQNRKVAEAVDKATDMHTGWAAKELDRQGEQGLHTPEEQGKTLADARGAQDRMALAEVLDNALERGDARRAQMDKAVATPAANDAPVVPISEPPPAGTARVMATLPDNTGKKPIEQAFDMRDALKSIADEYAAKGTLTPEQAEHAKHVNSILSAFKDITGRKFKNMSDGSKRANDYIDGMLEYGRDAIEGQTGESLASRSNLPGQTNPNLLDSIGGQHVEGKLHDVLGNLAETGSKGWVRTYAKFLQTLNLPTKIMGHGDMDHPTDAGIQGQYTPAHDAVDLFRTGMSEHVLLHEATHAAQAHLINFADSLVKAVAKGYAPRNQFEARMLRMGQELDALRNEVILHASADKYANEYGLTNNHEFLAELNSNPSFQQFLKDTVPAAEGSAAPKSLWQRAVDFVKKLFGATGKEAPATSFFDRAMSLNDEYFDVAKMQRDFDSSPAGALQSTDQVLHSMASAADHIERITDKVVPASRGMFQKMLGWKTVDFIAHQVRTTPAMVESGFAKAVDGYRAARDARRVVAEQLSQSLGDYAERTKAALRATKDAKAFNFKLMRIAGEASINGFDFTKNYADNLKINKALDAKPDYVNAIHREYRQLPESLQTALAEGAKQNRKTYVQTVSSLTANLMSVHTGVVPRLEAEIARLQPGDEARARLENQLAIARAQSDFAAKHMGQMDFMDKALRGKANANADLHLDGAASELDARVRSMFAEAKELPEDTLLQRGLAELGRMYYAQTKAPYFSLGRDGDHYVNIKFKDGVTVTPQIQAKLEEALAGSNKVLGDLNGQKNAFFRVDSLDQAQGLFDKLVKAGGADVVDVPQSSKGMLTINDMQGAAGVTPALRQLEKALHDNANLDASLTPEQHMAVKQNITRQLLSMLPETAGRSAKMERKGVPGYDGDFVGSFARRASGMVQDLSNTYTNRQFAQSLRDMKTSNEAMNRGTDSDAAARATMVAGEINKRYQNGMTRVDNTHINMLNSFGHSFYLAVSPAFFIRTMAQPYHRGVPILGARYGFVGASKEMAKATGTAMNVIRNSIAAGWKADGIHGVISTGMKFDNLPGLSVEDKGFIQELHDRGVLKLGQAQQLQHAMEGSSQRQQDVARLASMTAQYAEMTNRLTVGLAAFRMARAGSKGFRPMDVNAATEWANDAVTNAMDNFDPDNTARQIGKFGFAGKSTPLFTSFMNYNLQTMQHLARTVQDGYFAKDKGTPEGVQRMKEARREFSGLMAATFAISGALGMPFANAFAGVYNTLVKDNDDPSDIRGDFRNWLSKTFGDGAGDFIAHGAGSLINMDTSTFGLENLLPGSEFLASRAQVKDRIADQSQQLLGPALNGLIDVGLGAHTMMEGNYIKGLEQMLPSGIKPYYKAAELGGAIGPGGYTDAKGNPLPAPFDKAGAWDVGLQAAGFRTNEKATRDEAAHEFSQNQQILQHRREIIGDRVFKASQSGNPDDMKDAIAKVADFNRANPTQPITDIAGLIQRHMMEHGLGAGLGINLTKRQVPVAQQQLGYAAMPMRQ
jgi:hypothetical protein